MRREPAWRRVLRGLLFFATCFLGLWLAYIRLDGEYTDGAFLRAYAPYVGINVLLMIAWAWLYVENP